MSHQHSPTRSPFIPTRPTTHHSSTPPPTPILPSFSLPQPSRILNPSTTHNLNPPPPPTTFNPNARHLQLSSISPSKQQQQQQQQQTSSVPLSRGIESTAPKIRARLTPSASPRKKVGLGMGGTEWADAGVISSPPPLPAVGTLARVVGGEEEGGMEGLSRGMGGLGLGSMREIGREVVGSMNGREQGGKGKGRDNVLVCVRVRPPAAKLAAMAGVGVEEAWDVDERTGTVGLKTGGTEFGFDSVVTGTDNLRVYQEAGKELVLAAMEGFDAVIFAYGQTASGKTFTLSGNAQNPGIIPQAVTEIFGYIRDHPEKEFLLRASYLEIYNETLKDLLAPDSGPLKIRQDDKKRFFVHPLREEVVTGEAQVGALLKRGEENRSTGRTDFNQTSSRSHSVFQMTIESRNESATPPTSMRKTTQLNGPRLAPGTNGPVVMSRLSLIDLAGSEQATSQMERRSEGAFINKSLLTLEKVIASLTDDSKKKPHVPYRDSKLTQILQPSLSGDARVSVIATMNPSSSAVEETKSTLKFAGRVKKVVLKAVRNEVVDDKALIYKYRSHIAVLEAQLEKAMAVKSPVPSTPSSSRGPFAPVDQAKVERELRGQLEDLKSLFVTSGNIEGRRYSTLPGRAVSPIKMMRKLASSTEEEDEDESISWQDKYIDASYEITSQGSEIDDLKRRILELEESQADESRIEALVKENRELRVIGANVDVEGEVRKVERKWERVLERCYVYEEDLVSSLTKEREKLKVFERYIIQHLATQADVSAGLRRTSVATLSRQHKNLGLQDPGFFPLMEEEPDLAAISPQFVDLDDLEFSAEGRAHIVRSGSRLFCP